MERTNYMQLLMTASYPMIAIEAIKNGFDGAWERLISERLLTDYENGVSEAEVLIDSVEGLCDSMQQQAMKAAHLITSSKIPVPCE